jgi:hypothetical protein
MSWTAVIAVNAGLVRAFVVDEMFCGLILIVFALQVGAWRLIHGLARTRRFWLGFEIAGGCSVLAMFTCEPFSESALNRLLMAYVDLGSNLAYARLPDSLVDLIDERWDLFLAVVYVLPQLAIAMLGGAIASIVFRARRSYLGSAIPLRPARSTASTSKSSDRGSDCEPHFSLVTLTRSHFMLKFVRALIMPILASTFTSAVLASDPWVVYQGDEGPGQGKNVVLISGDEEYRTEEGLPQLAKILAKRHGFTCTVLFAIGKDGTIEPNRSDNIPGLEALRKADLMIIATRFRDLPEVQMKEIVDYVDSGRPIIGMRTATHAFNIKDSKSKYARYSYNSNEWDGGFGRQVLGETWISHHGHHAHESTRGIIAPDATGHPIVRGIKDGDIWGPTDVYGVRLPLPGDSKPVVLGQVVADMTPTGKPVEGKKNDPMMPVAWVKTYTGESGKPARVFTTTMGASTDLESAGVRRMLVNGVYWAVGLEDKIAAESDVALVGEFKPRPFGFNGAAKGVKPEAHQ